MNDVQLIKEFAEHGSETAFRSLVERHVPLVFGSARRITADEGLAEEIAQTVFILLARKAPSFNASTIVSGWLYRTTCFVAARALRAERRRKRREQEAVAMQTQNEADPAWQGIKPHLDAALNRLGETDRNALVLRFFEQRSLRETSSSLGLSEEATKKRVARALEKLRRGLSRRGREIAVVALAAGLTQEAVASAAFGGSVSKITAVALTPAATASSALLADVLAAWRWTKIKLALGIGSGLVATALLLLPLARTELTNPTPETQAQATASRAFSTPDSPAAHGTQALPSTIEFAGQTIQLHELNITVLDSLTDQPVPGARLTHSMMSRSDDRQPSAPVVTDSHGTATLAVPRNFSMTERMTQFQVWISATDYAPREIMWLSSTGSVLNLVSNEYTVRIESGITLFGTVVDEAGKPLPEVRVGLVGSNYRGYSMSSAGGKITSPPAVRVEDLAAFSSDSHGTDAAVTDREGRFQVAHFPSDLKSVVVDLVGPHGARRKFCTPQGKTLSSDTMAEVRFEDLQTGVARLVLPRGITVEGIVVDATGEPVIGAKVVEGTQWGNLKVLSRSDTDSSGRFWLSNRAPREIILAASASGHASASIIAAIRPGMKPVRIELPPEQALRGRVVDSSGAPIAQAQVSLVDIYNEGLGMEWSGTTDTDGRFAWRAAPTNEVVLAISHAEMTAYRMVRLRSSTNEHVIVLRPATSDEVRITGTAVDATTGKSIENFTVKIGNDHSRGGLTRAEQSVNSVQGRFELRASRSKTSPGMHQVWLLQVEAEGYQTACTRPYKFEEGDQDMELKLQPGGVVEGIVRSPDGEPAAACEIAIIAEFDAGISYRPGTFYTRGNSILQRTDALGHFKVVSPPNGKTLVAFHESGWSMGPIPTRESEIQLRPWARIEGDVINGENPTASEQLVLTPLVWDMNDPIRIVYNAKTDADGHFVFTKVPAGEYQVSVASQAWQRPSQETVKALQVAVKVSAGETQRVRLGETGRTATARLHVPKSATSADWSQALALLSRDVSVPPRPARSDFVSEASYAAASARYPQDPLVLASLRQGRNYVGAIAPDGTARFENVPPGNYILQVELYQETNHAPASTPTEDAPAGSLRVPIVVPDQSAGNAAITLGEFTLESR